MAKAEAIVGDELNEYAFFAAQVQYGMILVPGRHAIMTVNHVLFSPSKVIFNNGALQFGDQKPRHPLRHNPDCRARNDCGCAEKEKKERNLLRRGSSERKKEIPYKKSL